MEDCCIWTGRSLPVLSTYSHLVDSPGFVSIDGWWSFLAMAGRGDTHVQNGSIQCFAGGIWLKRVLKQVTAMNAAVRFVSKCTNGQNSAGSDLSSAIEMPSYGGEHMNGSVFSWAYPSPLIN